MPSTLKPTVRTLEQRLALVEHRLSQSSAPVLDSLLTQEVLAERLGHRDRHGDVTTRTLEDWRAKGIGPEYIRPPGTRTPYYEPAAVDAWLRSGVQTSTKSELR